jgi:hypothetical protein
VLFPGFRVKRYTLNVQKDVAGLHLLTAIFLGSVNLLNPTGYVMHQQFNIQQLYALTTLYLCVLYLSEKNSDLCHLQHKLIGFYNRDEKCLLRGTNWVFK